MIHFASGNIGLGLLDGFIGGLILGFATTLLMYTHGRTTGVSGIAGKMLLFKPGDSILWCYTFMLGLLVAGGILSEVRPKAFSNATDLNVGAVIFAGIMVGFGTHMGSGCTSGHGLCGLSRRSPRSLVAVCSFMATGILSASLFRETALEDWVMRPHDEVSDGDVDNCEYMAFLPMLLTGIVIILLFSTNQWLIDLVGGKLQNETSNVASIEDIDDIDNGIVQAESDHSWKQLIIENIIALVVGLTFGFGLGYAGMTNPNKVINFLNFAGSAGWDPSLGAVMGGGVLFNLISFHIMSQKDHEPLFSVGVKQLSEIVKTGFHVDNMKFDWKLIIGNAIFGIGWGLGGICPGPGFVAISNCSYNAHILIPCVFVGMLLCDLTFNKKNRVSQMICADAQDIITGKCENCDNSGAVAKPPSSVVTDDKMSDAL